MDFRPWVKLMKEMMQSYGLWQMVGAIWAIGLLIVMMMLTWRLPENLAAISAFLAG